MSNLRKLINDISKNPNFFENHEALLESLNELESLIGHEKVKNSMYDQIFYIVGCKKNTKKLELPLLNTVLYGPPGVGKTTVGECLAKIWMALGILNSDKDNLHKYDLNLDDVKPKDIKETQNENEYSLFSTVMFYISLGVFAIAFYMVGGFIGLFLALFFFIFLACSAFLLFYIPSFKKANMNNNNITAENKIINDNNTEIQNNNNKNKKLPITIVTRENLVGKYVGHTAKITGAILRESLGGVLFIDEAYSLVHSDRDDYGIECLNTINQFLSENKGKIICIFAGYKDKLRNGPFRIQPGLVRRFMWHIECEGYTCDELYKIYKYQCNKKGFSIKDEKETIKLFNEYKGKFPSYGGDTERTLFYTELEYYRSLAAGERNNDYLFDTNNIKIGINRMIDNNLLTCDTSKNIIENMLNMFENDNSSDSLIERFKAQS